MPFSAAPAPSPSSRIIAIDGPAGAGKSTVAAHLARHFGLLNLETGAMYRALALKATERGIPLDDPAALTALTAETTIALTPGDGANRVLLDGRDVTALLRTPEITAAASRVSVHPGVRHWMVAAQRSMGQTAPTGVVMEGRDVGTVVFPDATLKLFLDASVEARGDRRFLQTGVTPAAQAEDRDSITRDIAARDERDRTREVSPLRPADDAVRIDTTAMTLDEVLDRATALVEAALQNTSNPVR
ncbi:(d)CMP kinase [Terriglobus aquaticus]|uniref:Cytidylate kinase n=1 Tax=Terriglobus aquaticus TaxID=940139 RepID=A0ABW9KN73_9BACT|nr:(d)CMP kinase [Terriglobus aquaticus]